MTWLPLFISVPCTIVQYTWQVNLKLIYIYVYYQYVEPRSTSMKLCIIRKTNVICPRDHVYAKQNERRKKKGKRLISHEYGKVRVYTSILNLSFSLIHPSRNLFCNYPVSQSWQPLLHYVFHIFFSRLVYHRNGFDKHFLIPLCEGNTFGFVYDLM